MEFDYENTVKWFDTYFEDVNKYQGMLETIPNLKKYFTSDFEFMMYTAPDFVKPPLSREDLLMLFLHPGLHEKLTPQYYVVDVKRMIVVVQFEILFTDKPSGKVWPALQASAHYHLILDENKDLKIKKIQYWTESAPPEDFESLFDLWNGSKNKALMEHAIEYINTNQ